MPEPTFSPTTHSSNAADALGPVATQKELDNATVPPSLSFAISAPPERRPPNQIWLTGTLTNQGPQAVRVAVFPVHDRSPFFVEVVLSAGVERRPQPPEPPRPMVPPRSRILELPPGGSRVFEEPLDLGEWNIADGASLQLKWTFQFIADPKPAGTLVVAHELLR